jgi:hypothetical protein
MCDSTLPAVSECAEAHAPRTTLVTREELLAVHARIDALVASQPPEPLYALPQAALLLYVSHGYLKCLLHRYRPHLTAPKYRWDAQHISHRMLPLSDLNYLRSRLLSPSRSRRVNTAHREAIAKAG